MLGRYTGAYSTRISDGVSVAEISPEAQFGEFVADYQTLYKALKNDIETLIPKAKELQSAQLGEDLFTWGELADLGVAAYKSLIKVTNDDVSEYCCNTEDDYGKRRRIQASGIAITTNPNVLNTDDQENYVEKNESFNEFVTSLDSLAGDDTKQEELATIVGVIMKPALRYLYAYNALVDIIARAYALKDFAYLKHDLSGLEDRLDALNNIIFLLYGTIYGNDEEKQRKRALVRKLFTPIYIDELKPTAKVIAKVQTHINDLGFTQEAREQLSDIDDLMALLLRKSV